MMTTVPVLQRHIDEGECADPRRCALTLALNEATGMRWSVTNPKFYPILTIDERERCGPSYYLDNELSKWVELFDSRQQNPNTFVPLITFEFDPDDTAKRAHIVKELVHEG